MAAGDVPRAFARAAADDGIVLAPRTFDWLSELGHLGLLRAAQARRDPALRAPVTAAALRLESIYVRLKGDLAVLQACRANLLLPVDLAHEPTGTLLAIDGPAHFTSLRLAALELYPADAALGFDPGEHRELCRTWAPTADRFERAIAAKGFGMGGIQRQRAYRDALLDLGAPAMGHPPPIRVLALDDDGAAAYRRRRSALRSLLAGRPG